MTAKGYKLLRINKNEPGKLFPLYVYADEETPIGVWIDAKEGPSTENGKVWSRLGELAYRPGWHINDRLPYVTHIYSTHNGKKYLRDNCVWCEVEYNDDVLYQDAANEAGRNKKGVVIPKNAYLKYIPKNGYYKYKTSPSMYGEWVISGEMRVVRVMSDEEVYELCARNGFESLRRYHGNDSEADQI